MCLIPPLLAADSSDEFVVAFLDSRSVDDPVPSNVIADVDPFTIDPRLSSGDNWYMHKSVILDIVDERSVIKGNSGYWEFISNISISLPTSTHTTIGRKITRKFLLGNGTCGDKTPFGMHVYLVEQEKNKFKETRLSRIFSQIDEVKNEEESGDTGGEKPESELPFLVNQQEINSSLKQPENEYQGSNGIKRQFELPNDMMNEEAGLEDFIELEDLFDAEDGNSSFSGDTSVKSTTSDKNFESENEYQGSNGIKRQFELPNDMMNEEAGLEDFIELNDLFDPEDGNSSFWGNTSVKSTTSDENFELENEYQGSNSIEGQLELPNDSMNEENEFEDFIELKDLFDPEDGNSSFSGNPSMNLMTSGGNFESEIIGFDPEAKISDIANDVNNANASVSCDPAPVAGVKGKSKSEVSTSSSSESDGNGTSAKHSGTDTCYKRVKSRSAWRMAKLGKRYSCFI